MSRLALAAVLILSGLLLTPAAALACRGADVAPAQQSPAAAASATLCLVNEQRARHGLGKLRPDRRLARAARGHVRDMLRNRYFAHDGLDGRDPVQRIRDTGYARGAARVLGGENLAWARADRDTPRDIVGNWLDSAPHRRAMLYASFRAGAIVVATRIPTVDRAGSTYAMTFGG